MRGNLEDVAEYLNKMYGDFIQKVDTDPEDYEVVVVYGKDVLGGSHWRLYIYMMAECTELYIDDDYYVTNYDIEFFHKVYQKIETIADIYHKEYYN